MKAKIPDDHPIYNPLKLRIETPEIGKLEETIRRWIWLGATGGQVEGPPRSGKSIALEMLSSRIKSRIDHLIPCHIFTSPPRDRNTIQAIYRNLCISAGFDISTTKNVPADYYYNDFKIYLIEKAMKSGSSHLLLMVDEMQRLHPNQIEAFAELHDSLTKSNLLLTVIFTGNDYESEELLQRIRQSDRRHIQGRFFTHKATFSGIDNFENLEFCLAEYDRIRYPVETGPTYTEACLPDLYNTGFRMKQLAPTFWEAYSDNKNSFHSNDALGMKYFTMIAGMLLLDYIPKYGFEKNLTRMILKCIEYSGFNNR